MKKELKLFSQKGSIEIQKGMKKKMLHWEMESFKRACNDIHCVLRRYLDQLDGVVYALSSVEASNTS